MKNGALAVMALAVVSLGCVEEGDQVALNGRLFDARSMTSEGGGCSLFLLGSKSVAVTTGNALEFLVSERQTESTIDVTVTRGTDVVVARHYDAAFFQGGTVDEFTAPAVSGSDLLLRYWGTFHPGGIDGCAPLDAAGPR
jgi:hypothetical protein